MRSTILSIVLCGIGITLFAQVQSPLKFGQSYRIYPSSVTQTEVFISKSPVDDNNFFAICNTLNFNPFFISEGVYSTFDAGSSWVGSDTCEGNPIGYHGGDPGAAIDIYGNYVVTRLGRTPFVGLYSHYSTNFGESWSQQQVISTDDLERAALNSDAVGNSPYRGRTYAAWTTFASPFPVITAYSDNSGQTWSTPLQVNTPVNRCAGGDIAIGPGGVVYYCWAGVTNFSPFKEVYVGFSSSLDGGAHWNVTESAFPISGISGVLPNKGNIRVNSLPAIAVDTNEGPRKGWIYIITSQRGLSPAGSDPDVIFYRSTDGGITWSPGIRVNQDPVNNGKTQYFPAIHVDRYDGVDVLFYDDRTTTNDSVGVFLARSLDGGDSWAEYEICEHHFKPAPIGGLGQGYQGDNIDLSSNVSKIIPVWMDNSSGIYQLWTVPVLFADVNEIQPYTDNPTTLSVEVYPNPTRNLISLDVNIHEKSPVQFSITDIYGQQLEAWTLAEPMFGLNHSMIDFSSYSAGVYILTVDAKGIKCTKRVVKLN